MSDAFAHLPMLPEDGAALTNGSFMAATTVEDKFMEYIWRLRRWGFYGVLDLTYTGVGGPTVYNQIDLPVNPDDVTFISNGEDNVAVESAFTNTEEILESWRKTRSYAESVIINEGTGEATADIDFWWGPRATYDPSTGGHLDSLFYLVGHPNGDESFELSSDPDQISGARESSAFITFDPDGINASVPLYETDAEFYEFSGELIILPGGLYWPWTINGDPTYNTTTGAEENSPTRLDTNGYPLAYLCQQP